MSETIEEKALRLVTGGRVELHRGNRQEGLASVEGDTGTHLVSWDPIGSVCLCPARTGCSHVAAVSLFLDHQPKGETMEPEPTDEIETIEDLGPESVELAAIDPDPMLMPLDSTEISFQTLKAISQTEFVPGDLRGRPEALLACVLYGRELGLKPMQSLAHIDVIDGRPSPSAELLNRLIREAGHSIEVVESTDKICTLKGTRQDGESQELSFSIEDAMRAGLTSRPVWKAYPADMLWARTIVRLSRRLFPDVGGGSPTGASRPIR